MDKRCTLRSRQLSFCKKASCICSDNCCKLHHFERPTNSGVLPWYMCYFSLEMKMAFESHYCGNMAKLLLPYLLAIMQTASYVRSGLTEREGDRIISHVWVFGPSSERVSSETESNRHNCRPTWEFAGNKFGLDSSIPCFWMMSNMKKSKTFRENVRERRKFSSDLRKWVLNNEFVDFLSILRNSCLVFLKYQVLSYFLWRLRSWSPVTNLTAIIDHFDLSDLQILTKFLLDHKEWILIYNVPNILNSSLKAKNWKNKNFWITGVCCVL